MDAVEIDDVQVVGETTLALMIEVDGETFWVPKSAIDSSSEVYSLRNGGPGVLTVAEWWADKNGFTE